MTKPRMTKPRVWPRDSIRHRPRWIWFVIDDRGVPSSAWTTAARAQAAAAQRRRSDGRLYDVRRLRINQS